MGIIVENKFKIGDRVRVVKIDNLKYYSDAWYQIGDTGTIEFASSAGDYRLIDSNVKASTQNGGL